MIHGGIPTNVPAIPARVGQEFFQEAGLYQTCVRVDREGAAVLHRKCLQALDFTLGHVDEHGVAVAPVGLQMLCNARQTSAMISVHQRLVPLHLRVYP